MSHEVVFEICRAHATDRAEWGIAAVSNVVRKESCVKSKALTRSHVWVAPLEDSSISFCGTNRLGLAKSGLISTKIEGFDVPDQRLQRGSTGSLRRKFQL